MKPIKANIDESVILETTLSSLFFREIKKLDDTLSEFGTQQ